MQTEINFSTDLSIYIIKVMQKDKIYKMNNDIFDYRQKQLVIGNDID